MDLLQQITTELGYDLIYNEVDKVNTDLEKFKIKATLDEIYDMVEKLLEHKDRTIKLACENLDGCPRYRTGFDNSKCESCIKNKLWDDNWKKCWKQYLNQKARVK